MRRVAPPILNHSCGALVAALAIAGWLNVAQAQPAATPGAVSVAAGVPSGLAGEVEFSRGVGFAQSPGQSPRTLGRGLSLKEGDRLTTAEGGTAIVKLQDGTRMTVRPNSEMVIAQFKFKENATDNNFTMQLLRGGLRAITGLISKNSPNAARIQTATATIGIRGTDFDARLCRSDCAKENAGITEKARVNAVQASAKVVSSKGSINATDAGGTKRALVDGGSVYPGDLVETGAGTQAVLAFRDESKVTLGAATRFRVDNFVFDDKNPNEGRFLVSLLRGSVRALTGLIGKSNNRNVRLTTATATIGIRGTGFDADCDDAGCHFFNWLGSITITPEGSSLLQALQSGQGVFVGRNGVVRVQNAPTLDQLPRPDSVSVKVEELFTSNAATENDEGLFLFVRDGHIEIVTARDTVHLGRGETGFAGADGAAGRPPFVPRFLDFDRQPLPNSANPGLVSTLAAVGLNTGKVCK